MIDDVLLQLVHLYFLALQRSWLLGLRLIGISEKATISLLGAAVGGFQGTLEVLLEVLENVDVNTEFGQPESNTCTKRLGLPDVKEVPKKQADSAELSPCIEDLNIDTSTDKLLEEALYCTTAQEAPGHIQQRSITDSGSKLLGLPERLHTQLVNTLDRVLELRHQTAAMLHREEEVMPARFIMPETPSTAPHSTLSPLPEELQLTPEARKDRNVVRTVRRLDADAGDESASRRERTKAERKEERGEDAAELKSFDTGNPTQLPPAARTSTPAGSAADSDLASTSKATKALQDSKQAWLPLQASTRAGIPAGDETPARRSVTKAEKLLELARDADQSIDMSTS